MDETMAAGTGLSLLGIDAKCEVGRLVSRGIVDCLAIEFAYG